MFEEGTISISLKSLTSFGCLLVTGYLLGVLYLECSTHEGECSWNSTVPIIPTISSIVCKPFYDRVWMFVTTFFCMTVYQTDVRAFYKKLYGKATARQNEGVCILGITATISLPCIAYFDTHTYGFLHIVFTTLFFISCGFYIFFLAGLLNEHKEKFLEDEHAAIERANTFRWIMLGSVGVYFYVKWFCEDTHSSFYEWVLTLMYLNAVGIMSLTNKFYDTVHEEIPQPVTTVYA